VITTNSKFCLYIYYNPRKNQKEKKRKKAIALFWNHQTRNKEQKERKRDSLSGRDEPSISVSQASRPSFVVIVWDDVVCVCVCVCGSALGRITSNENPRAGVDLPEAEATEDL
jgi:hypothetical protein